MALLLAFLRLMLAASLRRPKIPPECRNAPPPLSPREPAPMPVARVAVIREALGWSPLARGTQPIQPIVE